MACIAAVVLTACSQEKDAFLNRTYHRLTARDNGWFNANEKLNEVVAGIEDAHLDDYDEVLPLFVYGTDAQAKAAIPDLEKCIEKCSTVIDRHSMEIKGKEKNTWIDDAYFVIAKSQFYKQNFYEAERGFSYIIRRYKDENRQLESQLWLARTAIVLEQYAKAQSALDQVQGLKKVPKDLDQGELSAIMAELNLRRGKVDDAIMHLERAVPLAASKRERVRWAFILAQLYERKGYEEKAIKQYAAVSKMAPPYEMAFHAQIFQALAFNKGDSKALRQKLMRMLRDDKHVDHFDMIHYALAELDLKDRKKPEAIDHLETSVKVSTTDVRQKAKSFLRLADIYFDDRLYADAQQYYDSTRSILSEEHVRYDEVDTRARVLGELVEQLNIIATEDSLQGLAQLDEDELKKKIRTIIRDREQEEEEKERMAEEARAREELAGTLKPPPTAPGANPGRGNWYFYDPQQLSRGLSSFRRKWGTRPLEDDWRRKDKSGQALADAPEDEEAATEDGAVAEKGEESWKDPDNYGKDIPRDEVAVSASNGRICEALYVSGMIYKEQLKDVDNAIESFEVLNGRFEECAFTPESHYQLYRIYLEKEANGWVDLMGGSGSKTYADIILERWPDSEFARLVRDPNVLQADEARRQQEEVAYKEVYQQYRQYAFGMVVSACQRVLDDEPRNHFRPKYHILKALAIGGMRDLTGYRTALQEVKSQFAGTDEAKAADDLLAALDGGTGAVPDKATPAAPAYTMDAGPHYFMLVLPNAGTNMADVKATLSDFNRTFMRNTPLEITNSFLDTDRQVILVQPFATKALGVEYHTLFLGNQDALLGINDQGYPAFAITPANYALLYKNKDLESYEVFFTKNYLGRQ